MDNLLQQSITALKAGDKKTARQLLVQIVQKNLQNEQAWLLLAAAVEGNEKRMTCLKKVLALNPDNEQAQRGLAAIKQKLAPSSSEPNLGPPPSPSPSAVEASANESPEQEAPSALPRSPETPPPVPESPPHAQAPSVSGTTASVSSSRQAPSPWLTIWTRPRETIRRIVNSNPTHHVILLTALAGLGRTLDEAATDNLGDSLPIALVFFIAVIAGPIGGLLSLYIGGAYIRWVGSWFGGEASPEEVRAAMAWASVPVVFALPLWVPELLLVGEEMFTSTNTRLEANPILGIPLLGLAAIEMVLAIWAFVLLLKCLGEVHGFSAWKALGTLIVGTLVIVVPLLCLGAFLAGIASL